jgi:hypothetical protein
MSPILELHQVHLPLEIVYKFDLDHVDEQETK